LQTFGTDNQMPLSGSCVIEIAGGSHAPETVAFRFADESVELLHGYLIDVQRLERSLLANGGFPVSLHLSATVGDEVTVTSVEPTDDQRAIFLHRLRPFQLQNEPFHFGTIKNIVAQATLSSPFMQSYLDRTKDMFFGKAMQEQIRVSLGETAVNSETAMTAWLYAGEYHRDRTKLLTFLDGRSLPPENILRPLLMLLLRTKIDAVLALGNIVHRLLSSSNALPAPDA
jgi:hypothetical protein